MLHRRGQTFSSLKKYKSKNRFISIMAKKNISIVTIGERMNRIVELHNSQKIGSELRDVNSNKSNETICSLHSNCDLWPPLYMLDCTQMHSILKYVTSDEEIKLKTRNYTAKRTIVMPKYLKGKQSKRKNRSEAEARYEKLLEKKYNMKSLESDSSSDSSDDEPTKLFEESSTDSENVLDSDANAPKSKASRSSIIVNDKNKKKLNKLRPSTQSTVISIGYKK